MRARVTVLIAGLAACGSSSDDSRDGAISYDAAPPDACASGDCEPLDVIATDWIVEYPETRTVRSGVAVPGGFVVLGQSEILRFTDDGALSVRRDVPGAWGFTVAFPGPEGDVLVFVEAQQTLATLIVRLDGDTTEEVWTYVVDQRPVDALPIALADGRVAVLSSLAGDSTSPWSLDVIESDGTGTKRAIDAPAGTPSELLARADGVLAGVLDADRCYDWTVDVPAATSAITAFDDVDCRDVVGFATGGGLIAISYSRPDLAATRRVALVRDLNGDVVASPAITNAGLVSRDVMIKDGRLASLQGRRIYHAPMTALDQVTTHALPLREGGFTQGSVLGSDGDRAFVAWLDQVSTFDTVLRVARLGRVE